LQGHDKWDAPLIDMKQNGWDINQPIYLQIGKDGSVKVGEGNHRLAIAHRIHLSKIPVQFSFQSGSVKKQTDHPENIKPNIVRTVLENKRYKDLSEKERQQIDVIMSLLA
jgi:hypothetical protein